MKSRSDKPRRPTMPVKLSEPENSQFQYQNFQSRSRLDARLWLACRIALVNSLMLEIRGMGDVKGNNYMLTYHILSLRAFEMTIGPTKGGACSQRFPNDWFFWLSKMMLSVMTLHYFCPLSEHICNIWLFPTFIGASIVISSVLLIINEPLCAVHICCVVKCACILYTQLLRVNSNLLTAITSRVAT